ncbi:MAG: sulfatase-like hydrolase/transferase [Nitrososphaerales archaeon]
MRFNVVLMVLDTLREDYSYGLRKLEDSGFVKYENAIAPSNWTIPSHTSMFTGRLPSSHGIHESLNTYFENSEKLRPANLIVEKHGILGELADRGYLTYSLTANPLVSPLFGFPFGHCDIFDETGSITGVRTYFKEAGGSWPRASQRMIRDRKTRLLIRHIYKSVQGRAPRLLMRTPLEKGSKQIMHSVETWKVHEPFMLFLNLMEAHQPYSWNDAGPGIESVYCYLTGKPYRHNYNWLQKYRRHADLAISRSLDIIMSMKRLPRNTLFIVTSDHGQLLGEMGKYDHGYFLDDALLRVPLYIKYPEGVQPFRQCEGQVSLCEIPLVIESALYGARIELGSKCAIAESFGPPWHVLKYAANEGERKALESAYRRKLKIYTRSGSFVLDPGAGLIEDRQKGVTDKDIAAFLQSSSGKLL